MKAASVLLLLVMSLVASAAPPPNTQNKGGFGGQNRGAAAGNAAKGGNANNNANKGNAASNKGVATGASGNAANSTAAGASGNAANSTAQSTAAGNNNANSGSAAGSANATATSDPQSSLTLDPKVIATGFANNGQDVPEADLGQVASLTSTNNFINFCLTVPNLPITNGQQITSGSCNPAPMGSIPSSDNMPSAKFQNPKNGDTIQANTAFTIEMAISNMQLGFSTSTIECQGQIQGHSHVVVETLDSLAQTTPTNPKNFAFFKGLNAAAQNGVLTADVTSGLPAGVYKLSSINTAANHQPVLVPIAQHGSLDDAVYFTVTDNGQAAAAGGAAAANNGTAAAGAAASAAASATATAANGKVPAAPAPAKGKVPANGANGAKAAP
ncbi:hypothetical protein BDQ17DRAFT_1341034, partial [Cyathus striatus]